MEKDVKNSLNDLLKVIKESAMQKDFEIAKKEWESAKDSQKLLEDFMEVRNTLGVFQQGNFPGVTEQRKKMMELYDKVNDDKMIQKWMKAQDKYQEFVWEQASYLTEELGFKFSPKPSGCCG